MVRVVRDPARSACNDSPRRRGAFPQRRAGFPWPPQCQVHAAEMDEWFGGQRVDCECRLEMPLRIQEPPLAFGDHPAH